MTRRCDNCGELIPLGSNYIEVKFIGIKEAEALFKVSQLDFCSLKCLIIYWGDKKYNKHDGDENDG